MLALMVDLLAEIVEEYRELEIYNACPAHSPVCQTVIQAAILHSESELYRCLRVRPDPPLIYAGIHVTADSEGAVRYREIGRRSRYGYWGAPEVWN